MQPDCSSGDVEAKCDREELMQSIHYHKTASKTGAHIQLSPSINAKASTLSIGNQPNLKVKLCSALYSSLGNFNWPGTWQRFRVGSFSSSKCCHQKRQKKGQILALDSCLICVWVQHYWLHLVDIPLFMSVKLLKAQYCGLAIFGDLIRRSVFI